MFAKSISSFRARAQKGEIRKYWERRGKKRGGGGGKANGLGFCFVSWLLCSISPWLKLSSISRRARSAEACLTDPCSICCPNFWAASWLVFKRLTQNSFRKRIRGCKQLICAPPNSCTVRGSLALLWSIPAAEQGISPRAGVGGALGTSKCHLMLRSQSLSHRLEESRVVLLYFVKNKPVRLSHVPSPSAIFSLPFYFLSCLHGLLIRVALRCTLSRGQWSFAEGAVGVSLFWLVCDVQLVLLLSL